MTREISKFGGLISEAAITFVERKYGKSKMSGKIVIEAMLRVTYWGLLRILKK
jgi:dolichol-phosphate mannosyltransferase